MIARPLLMSGPLVRAVLDGRKTQTRRIVREAIPPHWRAYPPDGSDGVWSVGFIGPEMLLRCPHGVPGDRLWVRETWRPEQLPGGSVQIIYRAGKATQISVPAEGWTPPGGWPRYDGGETWAPSILMPRWASRLTLEIVEVRVQRLHELTEEDARAEGIDGTELLHLTAAAPPYGARSAFAALWNALYADHAPWENDPYVWAITFRRIP